MNNDAQLLTEKYEEIKENNKLDLLTEQNQLLKDLVTRYKAALAANNQEEIKLLIPQMSDEIGVMFKPEAEEAVQMFENDDMKTTKGNYGRYMSFLSSLNGLYKQGMIKALRNAGAGQGLDDALRVMGNTGG